MDQAKKDRDNKLITEKEYLDKLEDYKTKEAALYKLTTDAQITATDKFIKVLKELASQFLENTLGIKRYTDDNAGEQEKVKDATKKTQDTVKSLVDDAYQVYFQRREQRIEQEKKDQTDSLNREKERVLARATSTAERETIERQYAKKQIEIEKQAGEKKKALALKQATIDFSVAVLKTFAALTGAYFYQRAQIQQQQFARGGSLKKRYGFGGNPKEVPLQGGRVGGRPHSAGGTNFEFGGQSYNQEVDELNIIRTKNAPKNKAYTISGSQTQIASALNKIGGGIAFAPGASVNKFGMGAALGSSLKAPYFSAGAYLNGGSISGNDDRMERLEAIVATVADAVYASDSKEVQLNPGKVTAAQKRRKRDTTVGDI